jgi:hypothetical protein
VGAVSRRQVTSSGQALSDVAGPIWSFRRRAPRGKAEKSTYGDPTHYRGRQLAQIACMKGLPCEVQGGPRRIGIVLSLSAMDGRPMGNGRGFSYCVLICWYSGMGQRWVGTVKQSFHMDRSPDA